MARKKSAAGRSKGVSAVQRVFIQTERINKRLKALEKAGLYGTYKSKELQSFVNETEGVEIKISVSGHHKVVIKSSKLSTPKLRLLTKRFNEFLDSSLSTPTGIKRARANMRSKIASTLSDKIGKTMSDKDVDKFLDIVKYTEQVRQSSILEYIDPSTFMILVEEAKSNNASFDSWINMLGQYVQINNKYMRDEAEYLYNEYVR